MSNQLAQLERALIISKQNLTFAIRYEGPKGSRSYAEDVQELQTKIQIIRSQMGQ